jgi:signal transduction histidine kinase/CheY-like chemotaxis protein
MNKISPLISTLLKSVNQSESRGNQPNSAKTLQTMPPIMDSRKFLTKVVQSLPDLGCVFDMEGNIISCNKAFDDLLRIECPGEGDDNFLHFLKDLDKVQVISMIRDILAGTRDEENPIKLNHRKSRLASNWSFSLLTDFEDEPLLIATGRAIRRKKSTFQKLNDLFQSSNKQSSCSGDASSKKVSPYASSKHRSQSMNRLWPSNHVFPTDEDYIDTAREEESPSQPEELLTIDYPTLQRFGESQRHQRILHQTRTHYMNRIETFNVEAENLQRTLEQRRVFCKAVAHEVRTPLNILLSGLNLLQLEQLDNQGYQLTVQDMKLACECAVDIMGDFLTYEKIDSDICNLEKTTCDLFSLVTTCLRPFHVQAKYRGMRLELEDCTEDELLVEADEYKMAQVLRNLVSNAIKFNTAGGVVRVRVSSHGGFARVDVVDQGAGISEENQARLFKDIVQFDARTLQGGGGSGIGLWVASKLMVAHGGRVGVHSKGEGHGSSFFIELPKSVSEQGPVVNASDKPMKSLSICLDAEYFKDQLAPRILIVDDSATVRRMTGRLLTKIGVKVGEAADGRACIEEVFRAKTSRCSYDAILMDSAMDGMCGPLATKELRSCGYNGKIFGVTGDSAQSDTNVFLDAGADKVFIKPLTAKCIQGILNELKTHS